MIYINTANKKFSVARDLYGIFFEDINRAGDGGLYPEMIRNRSFEDSLVPDGCTVDESGKVYFNKAKWPGAFNHGEGIDDWKQDIPETEIPGWYSEAAVMSIECKDTLNANRKAALKVIFDNDGTIWNIGYHGVPVKKNDEYICTIFVKTSNEGKLTLGLTDKEGKWIGEETIAAAGDGRYHKIDVKFHANATDYRGRFAIKAENACEILIGFVSVMPVDTYMGHGLRKDLVEMLKKLKPKFMRFPGGCVVEGMTEETAMRFSNTIGPVWERRSHNLMWHYRTTNGLGYHEYLQLCEDLEMEAMYVCNCGICCQARRGYMFSEESIQDMLKETMDAIEYAIGPKDSKFGAKRAEAGHPEPFTLKYLEIGNENWGEEYQHCYPVFYKAVKEKYPEIILISNSHTEKQGLTTEYADEHYYSTTEFFFENEGRFNNYDRKGPKIFIGEYAVNGGKTIASMECALAEAVFLTGVEKNQDVVTLSAYAPLFENMNYTAWKPNLIVFDNHDVYGIPTYHVLSLFGNYRGDYVIEAKTEDTMIPPRYQGIPGIFTNQPGLMIKNVKINGKPVDISKMIYGKYSELDGVITLDRCENEHHFTGKSDEWNKAFEEFIRGGRRHGQEDEADLMWAVFGTEEYAEHTFDAEVKFDKNSTVTFSIWNSHPDTDAGCVEPKDFQWNLGNVHNQIWTIADGSGVTEKRGFFDQDLPEPIKTPIDIDYDSFHTYKIVAKEDSYECYIDGVMVQKQVLPKYPVVYAAASMDDENVYIKVVNITDSEKHIPMALDCDIDSRISIKTVAGSLDSVNSMQNKNNVSVEDSEITVDGKEFIFCAKAHSVNVLIVKKR